MSDIFYFAIWYIFLFVIGLVAFPLTTKFFHRFYDVGWGLSKIVGLALFSYTIFILGVSSFIPLTQITLYVTLSIFVVLSLAFGWRYLLGQVDRNKIGPILIQEFVFISVVSFWAWVRGHQPDINGLEKFMDFGFINTIIRSESLPPIDMWHSGSPINYYWFGHFYTAIITRITSIPPAVTYNLMMATIPGLLAVGVFSIVTTLTASISTTIKKRTVIFSGIISTILIVFAGNFHTPFYALKDGVDKYWYPDATRFIGYNPETNDKTIHEFPLYSFVVSDLHGHVLNLPFVVLFVATLLSVLENKTTLVWLKNKYYVPDKLPYFFLRKIIPLGFVLGIMFMTSTWDFGNYIILTGFATLFFSIKESQTINLRTLAKPVIFSLLVFLTGLIIAYPFIANFVSIAEGVDFVKSRTPFWQLAILWGYPILLCLVFSLLMTNIRSGSKNTGDVFIGSLLFTAITLIIIPEIFYVKDIYIATHHRANTMFKLTYQAFVMSYMTSGYVFVRLLDHFTNRALKVLGVAFFSIIFGVLIWYPKFAINSYYADLKKYKGLSGDNWINTSYPDTSRLIKWANTNIKGQPVVLEASGDSYTEYNIVSSYTGLPTVSGWFVHEWLWRGKSDVPQTRSSDVEKIYTDADDQTTINLLKKYMVQYIVIGTLERQKYPNLDVNKILRLSKQVFNSGDTTLYKVNGNLIH